MKRNSIGKKKLGKPSDSNEKNFIMSDFYPMNWLEKERELWNRIMLEKKKLDS